MHPPVSGNADHSSSTRQCTAAASGSTTTEHASPPCTVRRRRALLGNMCHALKAPGSSACSRRNASVCRGRRKSVNLNAQVSCQHMPTGATSSSSQRTSPGSEKRPLHREQALQTNDRVVGLLISVCSSHMAVCDGMGLTRLTTKTGRVTASTLLCTRWQQAANCAEQSPAELDQIIKRSSAASTSTICVVVAWWLDHHLVKPFRLIQARVCKATCQAPALVLAACSISIEGFGCHMQL